MARSLYRLDGRLDQAVARDFQSIHHLRESISFYCSPLLAILTPHNVFGAVCQEMLSLQPIVSQSQSLLTMRASCTCMSSNRSTAWQGECIGRVMYYTVIIERQFSRKIEMMPYLLLLTRTIELQGFVVIFMRRESITPNCRGRTQLVVLQPPLQGWPHDTGVFSILTSTT